MTINKKCVQADKRAKGFTLVELSLAITFLAFIVLFIVIVIMQMINIYNKSVSLSQMNQAGRQIMSDLNGGARFSAAKPVRLTQTNGGRLCLGGTSYIWNIGDPTVPANTFSGTNPPKLRLVRVKDSTGQYCADSSRQPSLNSSDVTVLVGANVLVQDFKISLNGSTGGIVNLVSVGLVLSTAGNGAPSTTGVNAKCGVGNNFCAVARYNFIIYQRGVK